MTSRVRRVVPKKLSEELGRNRCTLYSGLVGSIPVQLVAVFENGIPRGFRKAGHDQSHEDRNRMLGIVQALEGHHVIWKAGQQQQINRLHALFAPHRIHFLSLYVKKGL